MADTSKDINDIFIAFGLCDSWLDEGLPLKPVDLEEEFGIDPPSSEGKPADLSETGYLNTTQFQSVLAKGDPPDSPLTQPAKTETVQLKKRKQQNRDAARKYRTKKKMTEENLKATVSELRERNAILKQEKGRLTAELGYLRQEFESHMQSCDVTLPVSLTGNFQ